MDVIEPQILKVDSLLSKSCLSCTATRGLKRFSTYLLLALSTQVLFKHWINSTTNSNNVKTRITLTFQWKWKTQLYPPSLLRRPQAPPAAKAPTVIIKWNPSKSESTRLPPDPIGRGRHVFFRLSRLHPGNSRAGAPPSWSYSAMAFTQSGCWLDRRPTCQPMYWIYSANNYMLYLCISLFI